MLLIFYMSVCIRLICVSSVKVCIRFDIIKVACESKFAVIGSVGRIVFV